MDPKARILTGLGAATAASCIPCFKNFYTKARNEDISDTEVLEAVELGLQMRNGALMDMKSNVANIMACMNSEGAPCDCSQDTPRCNC